MRRPTELRVKGESAAFAAGCEGCEGRKGVRASGAKGRIRCHPLCKTNPIIAGFGPETRIGGKSEPNRSQFRAGGVCGEGECAKQSQFGRWRQDASMLPPICSCTHLPIYCPVEGVECSKRANRAKQSQFSAFWGWKCRSGGRTKPIEANFTGHGARATNRPFRLTRGGERFSIPGGDIAGRERGNDGGHLIRGSLA